MRNKPSLVIFGGPNGSGKSTVYKLIASRIPEYYINADDITRSKIESGDFKSIDSKQLREINLEAAKETDAIRDEAIREGRSFTTESVMSTDKGIRIMNAAKKQGFNVELIYILTESPYINIGRIQTRVAKGGHPVPEEKTISRYDRCLELLPEALKSADAAHVYDNSQDSPVRIMEKTRDKEIRLYPREPWNKWTLALLEEIKAKAINGQPG